MLRVGIVAEGPSDWLVLEEVMKTVHPPKSNSCSLQPGLRRSFPALGNGWRGVKAWCEENGPRLESIMTGVPGRPLQSARDPRRLLDGG